MKRQVTWIVLSLLALSFAAAAAEHLKPVACDLEQAAFPPLVLSGSLTGKPSVEPEGLSPKALVGDLRERTASLKVAVDYSKPDAAEPDLLYVDFTGQGKFEKASAIPLKKTTARKGIDYEATFGPAPVKVHREGKSYLATVRGAYARLGQQSAGAQDLGPRSQVALTFAAAVESKCSFGKKEYPVRLVDNSGDFRFDGKVKADRTRMLEGGDVVLIDTGEGTFAGDGVIQAYYGQPVFVDGAWYELSVSPQADKLAAKPLELKAGQVLLDRERWQIVLEDQGKPLLLGGGKKSLPVPAGTYKLVYYREWSAPDPKGQRGWFLAGLSQYFGSDSSPKLVTVKEGETTRLALGSPLKMQLSAEAAGDGTVRFRLDAPSTQAGLALAIITRPGGWLNDRPDPPRASVLDAAGKQVATVDLEYG